MLNRRNTKVINSFLSHLCLWNWRILCVAAGAGIKVSQSCISEADTVDVMDLDFLHSYLSFCEASEG